MADPIHFQEEEEEEAEPAVTKKDFDCPLCSANNPYDEGFKIDDEIQCYYCGAEFKVTLGHDGRWRFREL